MMKIKHVPILKLIQFVMYFCCQIGFYLSLFISNYSYAQISTAEQLRLKGVKSAVFYPRNSRFRYFFGLFWLRCLEILLLSMPESMEAIAVQKSPKMPL